MKGLFACPPPQQNCAGNRSTVLHFKCRNLCTLKIIMITVKNVLVYSKCYKCKCIYFSYLFPFPLIHSIGLIVSLESDSKWCTVFELHGTPYVWWSYTIFILSKNYLRVANPTIWVKVRSSCYWNASPRCLMVHDFGLGGCSGWLPELINLGQRANGWPGPQRPVSQKTIFL